MGCGVSKIKELVELLPWGCKPFYFPRQVNIARKNPRRVLTLLFLLEIPYATNYFKTNIMDLVGLYALILPKRLIKLTLKPRKEAIATNIPYLVQGLT